VVCVPFSFVRLRAGCQYPSAGEVEGGGRSPRFACAEPPDGFSSREHLDLDPAPAERLQRLGVRSHLRGGAAADDQPLRDLVDDVVEVLENEAVPLFPPPVPHHPRGKDDHVPRMGLAVHDDLPEPVVADPFHTRILPPERVPRHMGRLGPGAASPKEDPEAVFRRVPGVMPSDEFKTANYAGSPQVWPTFMAFRDGQAVAPIMGPFDGSEWLLIVNTCPGSGIQKYRTAGRGDVPRHPAAR